MYRVGSHSLFAAAKTLSGTYVAVSAPCRPPSTPLARGTLMRINQRERQTSSAEAKTSMGFSNPRSL